MDNLRIGSGFAGIVMLPGHNVPYSFRRGRGIVVYPDSRRYYQRTRQLKR